MAGCSAYGACDVVRRVDHDLLCSRERERQPTKEKEHHKAQKSSPGLVTVGNGEAKKAVPRSYPPAEIGLPSLLFLPLDSHSPSKTLVARTSVNLSELSVDMRRER